LYKCDGFYSKESEGGFRFDDPSLNIDWQIPHDKAIISDKDQVLPFLESVKTKLYILRPMVMRKKILVTGSNGQLGMEIQQLAKAYPLFEFIFTTRGEIPLDNPEAIQNLLKSINRSILLIVPLIPL
jgi:hypothetical protein